ncbi:hypothetical protein C1I97_05215 [Streptomyces sp. NTH33]|uniref:hypothetical protein n=1 Tax=Streptomyces sp. NTH33 TaxID=1735453 RepID=UPI000DA816AA|nr:hypothetical protein [Streptomyces sp. NTH33]PZH17355.1 hypothetical protein C1I97_05215 [Streptomyces sp. NTH33]
MLGKRHGVMGAVLALLTLLAALFCATSVRSDASVASVVSASSAVEDPFAAAAVSSAALPSLDTADRSGGADAAGGPCLKKVVPDQPQPRTGAALISGPPTGTGETAWVRGSAHTVAHRCGPAPSPPDLTELSVRRV